MRISSLLNDQDVCWQSRETSNIFDHVYTVTPRSTVQSGRTHSKQVQLSDLSLISTKESGHISNHNGHNRRYSDEEFGLSGTNALFIANDRTKYLWTLTTNFQTANVIASMEWEPSSIKRSWKKRLPSRSQIQVQAGTSHLDKATSLITRANVSYPWILEALETTQSSAGSDEMIENVSRLNWYDPICITPQQHWVPLGDDWFFFAVNEFDHYYIPYEFP